MKVVITGGSGFIGLNLARALIRRGVLTGPSGNEEEIDSIVLFDAVPAPDLPPDPDGRVTMVTGDITGREGVGAVIDRDDISVFHLASVVSGGGEKATGGVCLDGEKNDRMAFQARADYQNHAIGWLRREAITMAAQFVYDRMDLKVIWEMSVMNGFRVLPLSWRRWRRMTVAAASFFLTACASGPDPAEFEAKVSALKAFLQDGVTRRDEVLARLGIPHANFEDGRIIGYYLRSRDELIVVFDEHGILERHSFLKFPAPQP